MCEKETVVGGFFFPFLKSWKIQNPSPSFHDGRRMKKRQPADKACWFVWMCGVYCTGEEKVSGVFIILKDQRSFTMGDE